MLFTICLSFQPSSEINNSCPRTFVDGIWWDRAARGSTSKERCPFNAVGNASRYCDPRKSWQQPNFFDCTSRLFSNIKTLVSSDDFFLAFFYALQNSAFSSFNQTQDTRYFEYVFKITKALNKRLFK